MTIRSLTRMVRRTCGAAAIFGAMFVCASAEAQAPATTATKAPATTAAKAPATTKAPRPMRAIAQADCVNSQCHANVKDYKVLHGPVNVNACDACHKLQDEKAHTFTFVRPKTETCTFCHKMDLPEDGVVHQPVQTGDCLPCHDPHGGKTSKFVRGPSMSKLCNGCHKDVVADSRFVHGPVAAEACESCHQPHVSKYKKLLVAEGKQLCFTCHKEMADQMKTAKAVHKPVSDGECSGCHDPHASNFTKQTKSAPLTLCTSCHEHEKILKLATESQHKHSVVVKDQACLSCHTAHGGTFSKLMRAQPLKVCMNCHSKPITTDGHQTAAVAEVNDPKQIKHGPIQNGNCSGCHEVHGSQVSRLLAKPYPEVFYQAFAEEKYELCFTCHDKQLVLQPTTTGLTNFRNGDANLHFLHVNRPDKGRSCRACHETHASRLPLHLAETVPYGNWKLPINFEKTGTGGSCSPGCHKPYSYDRVTPKATAATQPVAAAAN